MRTRKITVRRTKVRGVKHWVVRWTVIDKVRRMYFTGKDAAGAQAAKLRGQNLNPSEQWAAMDVTRRV
jgi:hypothetical protein